MYHISKNSLLAFNMLLLVFFSACNDSGTSAPQEDEHAEEGEGHQEEAMEEGTVRLSSLQIEAIGLKLGELENRNLSSAIKVTGELEVPPQSHADVSATVGGNVREIKVIEGDQVRKGQVLAYLEHPELVQMQVDLQQAASRIEFLRQEYERHQRLYEQKVGSGKDLQEATANYNAAKAGLEGLKSRIQLLGLNPNSVLSGKIYQAVPVTSPINGSVGEVNVNLGQYVSPQDKLISVIDRSDIHADFMAFEKDIAKVKVGQQVMFTVANDADRQYTAIVYNISPAFENEPKAVHLHADIQGNTENLIPGTYVQGRIIVDTASSLALPQDAIVQEGEQSYIFIKTGEVDTQEHAQETPGTAKASTANGAAGKSWVFKQIPVVTGGSDGGWVEVKPLQPIPQGAQIAYNGAYNLVSEMKKGETEHGH